jgi:hypothetical protein
MKRLVLVFINLLSVAVFAIQSQTTVTVAPQDLTVTSRSKVRYLSSPVKNKYFSSLYYCDNKGCESNIGSAIDFREADNNAGIKCAEGAKLAQKQADQALAKSYTDLEIYLFVELKESDPECLKDPKCSNESKNPKEIKKPKCSYTLVVKDLKSMRVRDRRFTSIGDNTVRNGIVELMSSLRPGSKPNDEGSR